MTCVLSIPALYANQQSEGGADLQNTGCDIFEFNWINTTQPLSGSDYQRCPTPCYIEVSTGLTSTCKMEVSNGFSGSLIHEQCNVQAGKRLKSTVSEKLVHTIGKEDPNNELDTYSTTNMKQKTTNITDLGFKRKANITECIEVYTPSKRISPFLNTRKARKDERKKLLKISIKKLKQLEDPTAFLRRTVLVNNTTKRLQTELRQEQLRSTNFASNKKKSFGEYGVLNNDCLSDCYLLDDPFLSGVHEKITDDMTDTLINNVFHDKTNDETTEPKIGENSEVVT